MGGALVLLPLPDTRAEGVPTCRMGLTSCQPSCDGVSLRPRRSRLPFITRLPFRACTLCSRAALFPGRRST